MKLKNLLVTTSIVSLIAPIGFGTAIAQEIVFGGDDVVRLSGDRTVFIEANNDSSGINENVVISVAGQTQMTIATEGTTINDSLSVSGSTTTTSLTVSGTTALNSTLNVVGNADFQQGVDPIFPK